MVTPKPHQQDFITSAVAELTRNNRATCISPCGTGKTLSGVWVMQELSVSHLLIFVPSLWLMNQVKAEISRLQYFREFKIFGLCSEKAIFEDLDRSELDFDIATSVETASVSLKAYFECEKAIFFTTYQSSENLALAMCEGQEFGGAIFDEAHCTAGIKGKLFATGLDDKKIPIAKRLFLTATPRSFDVRKKSIRGDLFTLYSMSDHCTYGQRCYEKSFREAINEGLICDYRVVIPVITRKELSREILERHSVEGLPASDVAQGIALLRSCADLGIRKLITFFNRIDESNIFVKEVLPSIDAPFASSHISSETPRTKRREIMSRLDSEDSYLVSNARCLTMGIDVPSVDMVAFMRPKKGEIDIIQALGRAIRKDRNNPDKKGYIFIPLFTEDSSPGEIENAINDAGLNYLWDTLSALREEDASLDDWVSLNRGQLGLDAFYEFNNSGLIEIHSNAPDLDKNLVLRSIESMVLEKLGESWDEMYARLKAFIDKNGHMIIPHNSEDEETHRLHVWVKNQRISYRRGTLRDTRIERLNSLDFQWNVKRSNKQAVNELYQLLATHKDSGHDVNVKETEKQFQHLYRKIKHIRERYRKGTLSDSDVSPLKELGLKINFLSEVNEAKLKAIAEFKQKHPGEKPPTGSDASNHIIYFRKRFKQGKLNENIVSSLLDLGVSLENQRDYGPVFERNLDKYRKAMVKGETIKSGTPLHTWKRALRRKNEAGQLSTEQLNELAQVGIELK